MANLWRRSPFPVILGCSSTTISWITLLTEATVPRRFQQLTIQKFMHPYHRSPEPPIFDWLNREFGQFLDMIE